MLEPDGATFRSRTADAGVDFLASCDEWFGRCNLATGPDGPLYVVDMIEPSSSIRNGFPTS